MSEDKLAEVRLNCLLARVQSWGGVRAPAQCAWWTSSCHRDQGCQALVSGMTMPSLTMREAFLPYCREGHVNVRLRGMEGRARMCEAWTDAAKMLLEVSELHLALVMQVGGIWLGSSSLAAVDAFATKHIAGTGGWWMPVQDP